jgi:hypothetical protein
MAIRAQQRRDFLIRRPALGLGSANNGDSWKIMFPATVGARSGGFCSTHNSNDYQVGSKISIARQT